MKFSSKNFYSIKFFEIKIKIACKDFFKSKIESKYFKPGLSQGKGRVKLLSCSPLLFSKWTRLSYKKGYRLLIPSESEEILKNIFLISSKFS